jgi:hypothetical protein
MMINSPAKHGPRMEALIDHPTTMRKVEGNRQAAKAFVETLVAWLRDSPDCPYDNDEAVANDLLCRIEDGLKMHAAAARERGPM